MRECEPEGEAAPVSPGRVCRAFRSRPARFPACLAVTLPTPASTGALLSEPAAAREFAGVVTGRWAWGILVLAAFCGYAPALRCGYIWDDDAYLTENHLVQSPDGLSAIWFDRLATPQYYPLVYTSFWLEHQLWGLNPAGYHLTNIVLHSITVVLVSLLIRRWNPVVAFWTALLFAVHPVHVESVAWVTERKNVLSGVFYVSAFLVYWRWREASVGDEASQAPQWSHWRYGAALGLFCCALLSKSITATWPAAVLVTVWWREGRIRPRDVLPLVPFFLLGIAGGLQTAWLEKHHVFAQTRDLQWSVSKRLVTAGAVPWFYLGKLLVPWPLLFFYPRWTLDGSRAGDWLPLLATAGLLVGLLLLARRGRRGPLAAALLFGGTLFPVLGLLPVYPMRFSVVADHFQYLASLAPLALVAVGIAWALQRSQRGGTILGGSVALVLASLTWHQLADYRDAETLWRRTLAKNPDCYQCVNNLAARIESAAAAEPEYRRVVAMAPLFEMGWSNLAESLERQGKTDEAIEAYGEAVRIEPRYSLVHARLAQIHEDRGDLPKAIDEARLATRYRPSAADYSNLGRLLAMTGELEEATRQLDRGLTLDPDHVDTLLNRASLHVIRGETGPAAKLLRRARALRPQDPRIVAALAQLGVTAAPAVRN